MVDGTALQAWLGKWGNENASEDKVHDSHRRRKKN